jgi:hypothetical protein
MSARGQIRMTANTQLSLVRPAAAAILMASTDLTPDELMSLLSVPNVIPGCYFGAFRRALGGGSGPGTAHARLEIEKYGFLGAWRGSALQIGGSLGWARYLSIS